MSPHKESLWPESGYTNVYNRLEDFAPKEKLNNEMLDLICDFAEKEGFAEEEISVAEVGAGPAPLSRLLTKRGIFSKAFDIYPSVSLNNEHFPYDRNFDLLHPEVSDEDEGKYDFVVMENVWYTSTLPPKGTPKYTEEEAKIMRLVSLKKASSLLRPGGFLVLSDPLKSTQNLGLKKIKEILNFDKEARLELKNEEKNLYQILFEYVKDPEMKKILKINKEIMGKSVLLDEEGFEDIINSVGMFEEKVYKKGEDYLGTNMTVVLRRNGSKFDPTERPILGDPVVLEGKVHENILRWIGRFRRKAYAHSGATENLPEVDKFDFKPGVVVLYPAENKLDIAAVATLQPKGEIGLDLEELMKPEEGEFYDYLSKKVAEKKPFIKGLLESGKEINYAEIRRLAAIDLDIKGMKKLLGGLDTIFRDYCLRNDIDSVLFISDPTRFRMFNLFNGEEKFTEVDGFSLNREHESAQTVMLYASDYFFEDWKKLLNDDEILLFDEFRKLLGNGGKWTDVVKGKEKEKEFRDIAWKILDESKDNVSLYCVQIKPS